MNQIKIGEFLKSLRKAKGITQAEAADDLFVGQKTISRWETGESVPDVSIISDVAKYYDVTVDELLNGERKSKESNISKEESKIINKELLKGLNTSFNISISIFGGLTFLSLLLTFMYRNEILIFILCILGMILGLGIYLKGYCNLKNKIKSQNFDCYPKKEIKNKNILFYDCYSLLFIACTIINYLIVYVFTNVNLVNWSELLTYPLFIIVMIVSYFLIRSMIKKDNLEKKEILYKLNIMFFLTFLIAALFLINIQVEVIGEPLRENPNYGPGFLILCLQQSSSISFGIIGLAVMAVCFTLAIITVFFKKPLLTFITSIGIFIGNFIPFFDYVYYIFDGFYFRYIIDIIPAISLVISLLIGIYEIKLYKQMKKE